MRWASPLLIDESDTSRVTPLFVSTEFGGRFQAPASVDVELDWDSVVDPDRLGEQVFAAAYQGDNGTRMVVVGTRLIADDQTIQESQGGIAGLLFFQNVVDWLAQDESLISIRSKDRSPPRLLFQSEFSRDLAKWGNLLGVPLLFVLFGMVRLTRRRAAQRREYETGGALL